MPPEVLITTSAADTHRQHLGLDALPDGDGAVRRVGPQVPDPDRLVAAPYRQSEMTSLKQCKMVKTGHTSYHRLLEERVPQRHNKGRQYVAEKRNIRKKNMEQEIPKTLVFRSQCLDVLEVHNASTHSRYLPAGVHGACIQDGRLTPQTG